MELARLRLIIDSTEAAAGAAAYDQATKRVESSTLSATGQIGRMETALDSAAQQLRVQTQLAAASTQALGGLAQAAGLVGAAFAAWEAAKVATGVLNIAARFDTLGIAMNVVGNNAGYTQHQMEGFDNALRKNGISMVESRNNLARMAAAQLDVAKAADLGRVAQDAAVIAGINSSEAFERLVQGIVAGQPRILHTMGLFANFADAERKWAEAHNKTLEDLSDVEKVNIRLNVTLAEGAKRAGVYEAALGSAGKQLQSSKRYLEDFQVKLGEVFQPQYTALVFAYSDTLKFLGQNARLVADAVELLAGVLAARFVNSILQANAATITMRQQVLLGNAVMLDSVAAQRGAAAAAVTRAEETRAATMSTIAVLQAERAAIQEVQVAERQRLATAVARVSRAVPEAQMLPLGGNVAQRDNAAVVLAMKERQAATEQLANMQRQLMVTDEQLVAANTQLAASEAAVAAATARAGTVMAATSIAARGMAAASGAASAAVAALGGPIGVAIILGMALNAVLDHYGEAALKAAEQTDKQKDATDRALAVAHARAAAERATVEEMGRHEQKYKALLEERGEELGKLQAVNAAYGKSDLALKVLGISYDAMIQHSRDAKDHKGAELAALDKVTFAIRDQQIAAARLADNKSRADLVKTLERENEAARINLAVAGESIQAQQDAATQAKISSTILQNKVNAQDGDTAAITRSKEATREKIAALITETAEMERQAKVRDALANHGQDVDQEIRRERELTAAITAGAVAVRDLQLQHAADNAVRELTKNWTEQEIRDNATQIDQYRQKQVELGKLRQVNQDTLNNSKKDSTQILKDQKAALKASEELMKTFVQDAQRAFTGFLESAFSGGYDSFGTFIDGIKKLFIKFIAEMAALQLGKSLLGNLTVPGSALSRLMGTNPGTGIVSKEGSTMGVANSVWDQVIQAGQKQAGPGRGVQMGATAISAGFVGYGIGASGGGNKGSSALFGAAGGAASGAAIGTAILPGLGTAIGAAVGAIAGFVGGIIGAGHAAALADSAMQNLQRALKNNVDAIKSQLANDVLGATIASVKAQFDSLRQQTEDAYAGGKNEAARNVVLKQLNDLEAQRVAQLKAEFQLQVTQATEDANVRTLRANGMTEEANSTAFAQAQQREYAEAVKKFTTSAMDGTAALLALKAAQEAEAAQLARDIALKNSMAQQDYRVRLLAAQGRLQEADALKLQIQQEREYADAVKTGLDDATLAALKLAQAAEAAAIAAAKAETAQRNAADLQVRFLNIAGPSGAGADFGFHEQQRRELVDAQGQSPTYIAQLKLVQLYEDQARQDQIATDAQVKAIQDAATANGARFDQLIQTAQDQLKVGQEAQQTAQANLDSTKKLLETLADYQNSLKLDQNLSPMTPGERLAEAKRQLDDVYQRALGGDKDAAGQLPGMANQYLTESRSYNASSSAYQQDYTNVQQMVDVVSKQFQNQQTTEEKILQAIMDTNAALTLQLAQLQQAKDAALAAAQAQIAALQDLIATQDRVTQRVVDAITAQAKTSTGAAQPVLDMLAALRSSVDASGQRIVDQQAADIIAHRDAVAAAAQAEIDAIRGGADMYTQAINHQISELEQKRLADDIAYTRQIAELAAISGWDSDQVHALELNRSANDAAIQRSIDALHGVGTDITGAVKNIKIPETPLVFYTPGTGGPTGGSTIVGSSTGGTYGTGSSDPAAGTGGQVYNGGSQVYGGSQVAYDPAANGLVQQADGSWGLPGYASGGDFAGGLRVVGEHGPELELTGASHIVNAGRTSDTLADAIANSRASVAALDDLSDDMGQLVRQNGSGLAAVVAELREVKKAVADLKNQTRRNGERAGL